ncbi:MAG: methionine synthase [Bdellovibrionales bacterium RIFOXYD12_FULL_39_22]|nr:MAG: methionine synthase [Bdellovibrionales bacterium RIFOXYB1_FULL_39_21]OFZ43407.1 MAG: methionine synthase [Bdellovibrionales bacterium RIFOXYC12_FULL_39_17]OFZ46950.1 MAG: methionine synthase [Bdellovibrionales bacterium RIFOXYC1_FULL_39_130]OFZ76147.1 MAG: methionine synthase [Bdellovibrionales bacterium RIFOXYD1_FULL_39_84]OFZ94382.1 MAG: methionine synthase [Bdellovibrionales bacterium RIFOXYD12_FULL_39_22]HLE10578.1 methionine synthase [Bacteriovoracaceae bacterium]
MNRKERIELLQQLLNKKILVLDGATGTALQGFSLTAQDFGGKQFEGCNEHLNLISPHIVKKVHQLYLEVGADIIETNSFGSIDFVLGEYGLADKSYEISRLSGKIAREMADLYSKKTPEKVRFVAGSMGPTTKSLTITGGISFEALVASYYIQAQGLYDGEVDYFLVETCNDTRNIKAAIIAIEKLLASVEVKIPIAISVTIEAAGTMLAGQTIEALITSLEHKSLLYLGINCATGPEFMADHVRTMSKMANTKIACVPNAGLPDENGCYLETPSMMAKVLEGFIDQGWINLVGGCCGTNAHHIQELAKMVATKNPRKIISHKMATLSGVDYLELSEEKRPILVGERTNVIGSKQFKELIAAKKFDEAAEIAKTQVKNGADIIDVCLANPDSNELADMKDFLEQLIKKIRTPLMIDSTDPKVIEEALTYCQGKSIINSINLENGEKKFKEIASLACQYGASLVVGTIDDDPENGMAITRSRKLEVAERSYYLLKELNIPDENIFFDPLVFPCGTGDVKYRTSAIETIEGLRLIKDRFPRCKSAIGVSNVSFGLPPAGREVLNSVFLYHCVKAGLDLAIVNAQKLKRFASISSEEIKLCEDLLWNRMADSIAPFVAFYRGKKDIKAEDSKQSKLSASELVTAAIVDGMKGDLEKNLNLLLNNNDALSIINGPLMDGMKLVGKLFNENKLIVAEVLQSAEVMKSAVDYLKPHLSKNQTTSRGKLLLATVKGDVHDIGKNLVDIIFSNNGFDVVNLGIKISSEQLIIAHQKHRPDLIGLSGLLVKSANEMVNTAIDLAAANITTPILCGGAALSKNFVTNKISVNYKNRATFYAKDAMSGLDLANKIVDKKEYENLLINHHNALVAPSTASTSSESVSFDGGTSSTTRSSEIKIINKLPIPPDFDRHVLKNTPVEQLWNFINPKMLLTRHLGINGKYANALFANDFSSIRKSAKNAETEKAISVYQQVQTTFAIYKKSLLTTGAVYQFFRCKSTNNSIALYHPTKDEIICQLPFPRQTKENGLSLADYVTSDNFDSLAIFFVTVGSKIRQEVEQLKASGNFLQSHILAALTLELAEAYAEYLHSKIRALWGFADPIDTTMTDRFHTQYHGRRYSYGYPACPNLEDQKIIYDLLNPASDIGLNLTDSFMMDPEASVSALVFHHEDAKYFSV